MWPYQCGHINQKALNFVSNDRKTKHATLKKIADFIRNRKKTD